MAKKLISVWLSVAILLFSSISIYAEDYVKGDFFVRNINMNGAEVSNYQLNDPIFMYKYSTYLPLTTETGSVLGYTAGLDSESRTLKITKKEVTQTDINQKWLKNNGNDIQAEVLKDYTVTVDPGTGEGAKQLDLKGLPVLKTNTAYYVPLSALTDDGTFGWSAYYDSYSGLYISTKKDVAAQSLFNEPQSRYNRGLVNYIKKSNGSYTTTKAQELVFLFQHEAEVNGVDPTLLMAVSHKESTFNPKAISSSGCIGLMQIMPSTAAKYGISRSQLYDPKVNVGFGSLYLKEHIDSYGGNVITALSAYNQGAGAVSRGSYSTGYAKGVTSIQNNLKNYLSQGGYGTGK